MKYVVTDRGNNTVTLKSPQGVIYKQNISFVKKYHDTPKELCTSETDNGQTDTARFCTLTVLSSLFLM